MDSCRNTDRGFATASNLMSLLKMVQIQYHIGVSLGSFIKRAITLRETWTRGVCARGRPCTPPNHWPCNLFVSPPSDAEIPVEVAENFDDGQPWFDINEGLAFLRQIGD